MELYVVQHGEAKTEAEDPQRSLTDRGRHIVERMARFLEPLNLGLQVIEPSDKLRARQTAEILAARLRPAHGTSQAPRLAPKDDIEPTYSRLQSETATLMLVGHLPFLGRLANRLLAVPTDRPAVQLQVGGAVRLDRDEQGAWIVRWVAPPEVLGGDG